MPQYITKQTRIKPVSVQAESSQSVTYIIYFLFGLLEVLLLFRLVFKLTGANPVSQFVSFIYSLTGIFVSPFLGIFRTTTSAGVETSSILEPATLVALVVYALLAWGLAELVVILSRKMQ